MNSRHPALVAAATLLSLGTLGITSPAHAARPCNNNLHYTFDGELGANHSVNVYGASAHFEYNVPDSCTGNGPARSAVSAWSMIAAESLHSEDQQGSNAGVDTYYAQSGYGRFSINGTVHVFSEWRKKCNTRCGAGVTPFMRKYIPSDRQPNTVGTYATFQRFGDSLIAMYADGTFIDATDYDPYGDWNSAWRVEYFGETHESGDDMPGVRRDVTGFNTLQYRTTSGDWSYYYGALTYTNDNQQLFGLHDTTPSDGQGFEIWTQ